MIPYRLVIGLYFLLIRIAAIFHTKAKLWVTGRKGWQSTLPDASSLPHRPIWMHCASHGEFEQGRPILEILRQEFPEIPTIVSFFSPSGFHQSKARDLADHILYLPPDSPRNARHFLQQINPCLALFVKYDLWPFFIRECHTQKIPLVLLAGLFRPKQIYFRPWGKPFLNLLKCFDGLLVQNENSAHLLNHAGLNNCTVTGDPRIDRVSAIADNPESFPQIAAFCSNAPVLICGSTHLHDERLLIDYLRMLNPETDWKFIIAPHEIRKSAIKKLRDAIVLKTVCYSELREMQDARVLIIDQIGMLSRLYQYGRIAYIGGGFGSGIHNTLEPFAFRIPVIMGPRYKAFDEAVEMQEKGGAMVVNNAHQMESALKGLSNPEVYEKATDAIRTYMEANQGASRKSMEVIRKLI